GYRLPAAILDLANRLLPEAAPTVTPAISVREAGDPPEVLRVDCAVLVATVAAYATELAQTFMTTAVIAPNSMVESLVAEIAALGADYGGPADSISRPLTILAPELAKGLEFDAVIVVEPKQIVESNAQGTRLLFVALTRAVQHLAIAHSQGLPSQFYDLDRPA
ncbi:MAG: hypothetical protein QOJ71_3106, partial [Actinomycetota bacterium]|nr:hypothetical protein [Actinomycetota bacterium]